MMRWRHLEGKDVEGVGALVNLELQDNAFGLPLLFPTQVLVEMGK
jgi:hypothetical protein